MIFKLINQKFYYKINTEFINITIFVVVFVLFLYRLIIIYIVFALIQL